MTDERYQPGGYHNFYIRKPKKRLISAAPFRDRVVHHALCNVMVPLLEKRFIPASYAIRYWSNPTNSNYGIGFRCSRSP